MRGWHKYEGLAPAKVRYCSQCLNRNSSFLIEMLLCIMVISVRYLSAWNALCFSLDGLISIQLARVFLKVMSIKTHRPISACPCFWHRWHCTIFYYMSLPPNLIFWKQRFLFSLHIQPSKQWLAYNSICSMRACWKNVVFFKVFFIHFELTKKSKHVNEHKTVHS